MPKPDTHIFVCAQRRPDGHPRSSCAEKGCAGVYEAIAQVLIQNNMQNVALTQTGCLGPCQAGSNVLIYPGGYMYSWVTKEDAAELVEQHVIQGKPIEERFAPAELW